MGLRAYFRRKREAILKKQTDKMIIPDFEEGPPLRKKVVFSGKVQGVGFRYETLQVCRRLELSGWVRNKTDGRVEAEVQGKKEKIEFLIDHLKGLKRMTIKNVDIEVIPLVDDDGEFKIVL